MTTASHARTLLYKLLPNGDGGALHDRRAAPMVRRARCCLLTVCGAAAGHDKSPPRTRKEDRSIRRRPFSAMRGTTTAPSISRTTRRLSRARPRATPASRCFATSCASRGRGARTRSRSTAAAATVSAAATAATTATTTTGGAAIAIAGAARTTTARAAATTTMPQRGRARRGASTLRRRRSTSRSDSPRFVIFVLLFRAGWFGVWTHAALGGVPGRKVGRTQFCDRSHAPCHVH